MFSRSDKLTRESLVGIGQHDESKISCDFTPYSFDLIATDWNGKFYQLLNDNLGKDIDVTKSKHGIKPNKIILKLGKLEAEYGYESWQQLTAKISRKRCFQKVHERCQSRRGIMDMTKGMYDGGGDNIMKKMTGEMMYK